MIPEKEILILYTGGTICSTTDGRWKQVSRDSAYALPEFLRSNGAEYAHAPLKNGKYFGILSENMTVEKWNELILHFLEEILPKRRNYAGILVAHGTDTLAYSAALFSLLLKGIDIPVLFVSSNEPLLNADGSPNPRANGNENFRCAVECICRGLPGGVFVPYKNPGDGRMYLHRGETLEQCRSGSEDFFSRDALCLTDGRLPRHAIPQAEKTDSLLIEKFKDTPLQDCVLYIEPYVGINYARFDLQGVRAVLHTTYHSGTVCVERTKAHGTYSHGSVLHLIDRCCNQGIDCYFSPAQAGDGDAAYDSVAFLQAHCGGHARFCSGITRELLYARLLTAYSLGFSPDAPADRYPA